MKKALVFNVRSYVEGVKTYAGDDEPGCRQLFDQRVEETYKGVCVLDLINLINNPKCLAACRDAAEGQE